MFRLSPGRDAGADVRAVVGDQIDTMLAQLDGDGDEHDTVHQVRKRCKKTRALVRLVRDAVPETYEHANTSLRDAARLISGTRDAAAAVETHDALVAALGDDADVDPRVRALLVARRDGQASATVEARLPEVRQRLAELRDGLDRWPLPDGRAVDVLRAGYARTYRRSRRRFRDARHEPATELWHQWRKRVKYHRHQVELLADSWEPVMLQREQLLHDLSDLLGEDHDIAELGSDLGDQQVFDLGDDVLTGYRSLLDVRREELRRLALPLGARLFAAPTDQHCGLVFTWWAVAEDRSTPVPVTTGPGSDRGHEHPGTLGH